MSGKLIVLEGTDASGKSTQFAELCRYCDDNRIAYRRLVFPRFFCRPWRFRHRRASYTPPRAMRARLTRRKRLKACRSN